MSAGILVRTATRTLAICVLVFASCWNCRGEDRQRELPKDGAWVQYQVEFKQNAGNEASGTITLSLVGTVVDNGNVLRWVEVKQNIPEGMEGA